MKYTEMLETAPECNPHTPCQWTWKPSSAYFNPPSEDIDTSDDNSEIKAETVLNDIPFCVWATTRNREDFKINHIEVHPDSGPNPNVNVVHVTAVPVYFNTAVIRRPQFHTVRNQHTYSSTYYLSDVAFEFSPDGKLFSFEMTSPMDIKTVVNENVAVLDRKTIFDMARTFFTYTDKYAYGPEFEIESMGEELVTNVLIDSIEYGLVRVRVPDSYDSYYYVPGVFFNGRAEFYGKYGKEPLMFSDQEDRNLLILNAIDGTVIQRYN